MKKALKIVLIVVAVFVILVGILFGNHDEQDE